MCRPPSRRARSRAPDMTVRQGEPRIVYMYLYSFRINGYLPLVQQYNSCVTIVLLYQKSHILSSHSTVSVASFSPRLILFLVRVNSDIHKGICSFILIAEIVRDRFDIT